MIHLDGTDNKLSSGCCLNMRFSPRFHYTDGQSFSQYKPLQNVRCWKVGNMQVFFTICTHLLTTTQEKKFEDVFLVSRASRQTTLSDYVVCDYNQITPEHNDIISTADQSKARR